MSVQSKTEVVRLRCTTAQKTRWQAEADRGGFPSLSAYIESRVDSPVVLTPRGNTREDMKKDTYAPGTQDLMRTIQQLTPKQQKAKPVSAVSRGFSNVRQDEVTPHFTSRVKP